MNRHLKFSQDRGDVMPGITCEPSQHGSGLESGADSFQGVGPADLAEAWLRQNDPDYSATSNTWKHLRRGNGIYRTPRERELPLKAAEGVSVDLFGRVHSSTSIEGRKNSQPIHDYEGLDTEEFCDDLDRKRVARWRLDFKAPDEKMLAERIATRCRIDLLSDRRRVRMLRKVYKIQREYAILRDHLKGKSYREIATMYEISPNTANQIVRRKQDSLLANSKEERRLNAQMLFAQLDRIESKLDQGFERAERLMVGIELARSREESDAEVGWQYEEIEESK
jgi:transposase